MSLYPWKVSLSTGQKQKLMKAIRDNTPLNLRLLGHQIRGPDELLLTSQQVNRLKKLPQKKVEWF